MVQNLRAAAMPMTAPLPDGRVTALTDRIAEVLREHCPGTYEACRCECGEPTNGDDEWAAHVAEQIKAELQLTEEWAGRLGVTDHHRWVSAWTEMEK